MNKYESFIVDIATNKFNLYQNALLIKEFLKPKKYDNVRRLYSDIDTLFPMNPEEINSFWKSIFQEDEQLLREFFDFIQEKRNG